MTDSQDQDYGQPVAYDASGRPLYAHPPTPVAAPSTPVSTPAESAASAPVQQVVHMSRPIDPVRQPVSPETQRKHEISRRRYPSLNLSEGEYVIRAVGRHPIGLFLPVAGGIIGLSIVFSILFNYDIFVSFFNLSGTAADLSVTFIPIIFVGLLIAVVTYAAYFVYTNNKFFLTNESVIQEIQVSLFAKHEQTVSLGNIEDASFEQRGILQQIFNYGAIRLSTEGDETTYHFTYVTRPKNHIAVLNNAVEAFKNGRPVSDSDN